MRRRVVFFLGQAAAVRDVFPVLAAALDAHEIHARKVHEVQGDDARDHDGVRVWDRRIRDDAVEGGDGRRDAPVLLVLEFGRVVDVAAVASSVEVLAGEGAGAVEGPAARMGVRRRPRRG